MRGNVRSVVRFAAAMAGGVTLALCIGSVATAGEAATAKRDPAVDRQLAPAIVSLETRAGHVTIFAGELGRYYTIVSKDGRVVAERVSADELAANHPEVSAMVDHGFAVQMADLPQ